MQSLALESDKYINIIFMLLYANNILDLLLAGKASMLHVL